MITPVGVANQLATPTLRGRWSDLGGAALPEVAAVVVGSHAEALGAVWTHVCRRTGELLVISDVVGDETTTTALAAQGFTVLGCGAELRPSGQTRAVQAGRIWITTSGTTGRVKLFGHTLANLTPCAAQLPPRRWVLPYLPGTYGWWQLVSLSITVPGQDLIPIDAEQLHEWPQIALREQATAVSGTPTFWRYSLFRGGDALRRLPLAQVTLGGEPVDQDILDQLARTFPRARITWIYGSTEAGISVVISDGRSGFPVEWLDRVTPGRVRFTIDGGELLVASARRAHGLEEIVRTGDLVEVADGRVLIVGRVGHDQINVGGSKISRAAVCAALRAHPAVVWATAHPMTAPLVGHLVRAEVVLRTSGATDPTEHTLITWCAGRLPAHGVPRRIDVLDTIPMTRTLKSEL